MDLVELIETITLYKETLRPKIFEKGTILKVVMRTKKAVLVVDDYNFSFVLKINQENKIWKTF